MIIITSKANNLIKKTKKLLQKKYRKHSYLIEGWHLFEEARQNGAVFEHIFVIEELAERLSNQEHVTVVTPEVLKELTESPTPQGIVAEVHHNVFAEPKEFLGPYLVLEDIQDPGNLGTIIRTADAAGFRAVFVSDKSADIYNQKTLRSMQGSHFHLPIYRGGVMAFVADLKSAGIQLIVTTLSSQSVDYREIPETKNFALVMGNEGQGVSEEMVEQADILAHISMSGQAESLNVAVAAGIMMFSLIQGQSC
ncbi:TrmH family RNA methyltransferase [Streptococcus dentapri]|uniref:TrmH family RNA methyltransferase n=1 Tax=Streptococcus dentapri TaxID=573564 RepID=A0ABV8D040_9STRE